MKRPANATLPALLVCIRHAIAVAAEEFDGPDRARPLTARGIRRAEAIMREVSGKFPPTHIIASPLVRAVQTAELLQAALGPGAPQLELTEALTPGASVADFRIFLSTHAPRWSEGDIIACIGHEPSIGDLFASLLGLARPLPFKKAGVGVLRPLSLTAAELVAFIPPKLWHGE